MRITALAIALLIAAASGAVAGDACLPANADGAVAEGKLVIRQNAFILELDEAICLEGEGDFDNVEPARSIHIAAMDDEMEATLKTLAGKRITVTGNMFGSHTQHHKAPIVMQITEATEE
jgi:hypothetical protein